MATKRVGKIEFYIDKHGDWRWRTIASNGKVTADSGEGYKRKASAAKGALSACMAIATTILKATPE